MAKKNVYIAHATSYDYQKNLYVPLSSMDLTGINLILPHQKNSNAVIKSKEIIAKCSCLIAEVSYPSTGLGIELGWADVFRIPVYCIYQTGEKYSASLEIINTKIMPYADEGQLMGIIKTLLKEL